MYSSLKGENIAELVIMGSKDQSPEQIYYDITTKGPLYNMFEEAELVSKMGAVLKVLTPMKVPYHGNVLVIGDAGAFVEVEVQGALMCGFHGGNAVIQEIEGEEGFEEYTKWWQESFEFQNEEELRSTMSTLLSATFCTDDELDYLFALTEDEVLEGAYSQWNQPKLMWGSILRHKEKIAKEMPELYEKIQKSLGMTFDELYSRSSHN